MLARLNSWSPVLFRILICPVIVFLVHIVAGLAFDAYGVWPRFDMLMHFLGGASIGVSSYFLLETLRNGKYLTITHSLVSLLLIVALTTSVAVVWEFHEFLLDTYLGTRTQPSIGDTMGDLFLGMMGSLLIGTTMVVGKKK